MNVSPSGCYKSDTGYDSCFNEKQLRAVNKIRLIHKETNLVTLDKEAAKYLHGLLNPTDAAFADFTTNVKAKVEADNKWKSCQAM